MPLIKISILFLIVTISASAFSQGQVADPNANKNNVPPPPPPPPPPTTEGVYQLPVEGSKTGGDKTDGDGDIFTIVEEQPMFVGGYSEMMKFIQQNFEYPSIAKEMGDQGTVYVQFVIEKDGSVSNVKVLRGVTSELDQEALRVVKLMPNWTPGKQKGKPVRARFMLPIKCNLGISDKEAEKLRKKSLKKAKKKNRD